MNISLAQKHHELNIACAHQLATILLEVGAEDGHTLTDAKHIASPAGSEQALRGIPVVGARGVGGTIAGTNPLAKLISKQPKDDASPTSTEAIADKPIAAVSHRLESTSRRTWYRRALVNMLIARDGPTCYLCGGTFPRNQIDIDHIIPISQGGDREDPVNLGLACSSCNNIKAHHYVSITLSSGTPRYHLA